MPLCLGVAPIVPPGFRLRQPSEAWPNCPALAGPMRVEALEPRQRLVQATVKAQTRPDEFLGSGHDAIDHLLAGEDFGHERPGLTSPPHTVLHQAPRSGKTPADASRAARDDGGRYGA